jgi:hypothetical protein
MVFKAIVIPAQARIMVFKAIVIPAQAGIHGFQGAGCQPAPA